MNFFDLHCDTATEAMKIRAGLRGLQRLTPLHQIVAGDRWDVPTGSFPP